MPGLNVVALISGGKDSLFSILHCQANGHNVMALANLHPPAHDHNDAIDDLDSYMYQTIGHAVIPLYEQALGLPLYRQEITGTAVNRDKNYSPPSPDVATDETESLFTLLSKAKQAHPEINAVSTGAILSDYQRTRVESVALRLGLVPLSYLWQWPSLPPHTQESLLEDMAAVGQDARVIKVASGGLDESFLWRNVADGQTILRLAKAAQRFGVAGDGAILGEGGEYETLAVAGPSPLWKGRIEVAPEDVQSIPGDAGSASVRIVRPSFTPLDAKAPLSGLRMPPLLDSRFANVRAKILSNEDDHLDGLAGELQVSSRTVEDPGEGVLIFDDVSGIGNTVSEQTRSAMDIIASRLIAAGHSIHDLVYTIVVLRNMSDFAAFNQVYGGYFTKPNPPARVTIACADALDAGALLSISITSALGPREGLHVQSRSYWAPANIGPYSQAIKLPETISAVAVQASVFIAGQIPLIPATMELPDDTSPSPGDNFAEQATLSLQHLDRIGCIMGVRQWVFGIVFIATGASHNELHTERAKIVRIAWRARHLPPITTTGAPLDEAEDFDVWDQTHGPQSVPWRGRSVHEEFESAKSSETPLPPLVVVQVDSLPRGADVEWVGFGKTSAVLCSSPIPSHLHGLLRTFRHRTVQPQC